MKLKPVRPLIQLRVLVYGAVAAGVVHSAGFLDLYFRPALSIASVVIVAAVMLWAINAPLDRSPPVGMTMGVHTANRNRPSSS